jgi:putative endonuclease
VRTFWVYIVASRSRVLYVGVTNDLLRRVAEHRAGAIPGFTAAYKTTRLVHCEATESIDAAIAREKQLKGWRRNKKTALVEMSNPTWDDLAAGWYGQSATAGPSLRSG